MKNPVIVFEDLKDLAWSVSPLLFRKISGLLNSRGGRGPYSSFHAPYKFLRLQLDHFFIAKSLASPKCKSYLKWSSIIFLFTSKWT